MELEMFSMHRVWWPDLVGCSKDMNQDAISSTHPELKIIGLRCDNNVTWNLLHTSCLLLIHIFRKLQTGSMRFDTL